MAELPVMNESECLEQCGGDWQFAVELLQEFMGEVTTMTKKFREATDYKEAKATAHSLKGMCLNLHLTAFTDVSKAIEAKAKALDEGPKDAAKIAAFQAEVARLSVEYDRLAKLMVVLQKR